MKKELIKSIIIIAVILFTSFYFLHNTSQKIEPVDTTLSTASKDVTRDEEVHEGYLVKYEDLYIFSDCYNTKIYVFPQPSDLNVKYENVNSSVSLSILNNQNELSLSKIEILNKKCKATDDVQLVQDTLTGYGAMSKNEAYIQDGHDLVLDQTKSIGTKNILTFQFLHYGDRFAIYQDTITLEKSVILNDKYEIKRMDPKDILEAKGKIAVFFSPSDAEIEEMKKDDEEGFYVGADDAMYYQSVAGEFLVKNNIKTVYTNKRYINFLRDTAEQGDEIVLDTKSIAKSTWGVLLFDGKSYPVLGDTSNIQPDYEEYFREKN